MIPFCTQLWTLQGQLTKPQEHACSLSSTLTTSSAPPTPPAALTVGGDAEPFSSHCLKELEARVSPCLNDGRFGHFDPCSQPLVALFSSSPGFLLLHSVKSNTHKPLPGCEGGKEVVYCLQREDKRGSRAPAGCSRRGGGDREAEPYEATGEKGCEPACVLLQGFSPRRTGPCRAAGQPCSQCTCTARRPGQQVAGGAVLLPVLDLACPAGGATHQGRALSAEPGGMHPVPGSAHQAAVRLRERAGGAAGPSPCAVPLIPAARAPLGRLHTAHPAPGFVGGEGLQHVQAVCLRPPAAGREGGLCTRKGQQAARCHSCSPAPWDLVTKARSGASPACLQLQLFLGEAEGVLHLVLGDGLPLARVLLEDVVPDDRHLVGEAEWEVAARAGRDRRAASLGHREQSSAARACGYTGNRATHPIRR